MKREIKFVFRGGSVLAAALVLASAVGSASGGNLDPVLVGQWPGYLRGPANAVAVSGLVAYVTQGDAGMQVIDVSNPANPVRVGGYDTSGNAREVAVSGHYAYVADGGNGLQVINVSNPTSPVRVGGYDTSDYAYGVAVSSNYAYVADGGNGLQVIEVSDPANPVRVGVYDTSGYAYGVAVSGNYVYVADSSAGLQIIDVSNPKRPGRAGGYSSGDAYGVAVSSNYAYVADGGNGLQVIEVSDPANPVRVGVYDTSGCAYGVAISGNYVYVADSGAGLQIIDVSNPKRPVRAGGYDSSRDAAGVAVSGTYAYVADYAGLQVIDVSNPAAPEIAGRFDTGGYAYGLAVSGNYACLADGGAGLQLIDILEPANPKRVSRIETDETVEAVAVLGTYAYTVGYSWNPEAGVNRSGFQVVDISMPKAPRLLSRFEADGHVAQDVAVSGDYAYWALTRWDEVSQRDVTRFEVLDISSPSNPVRVGGLEADGYVGDIAVSGNHAYMVLPSRLQVIDVSSPANPRKVGVWETSSYDCMGVALSGSYAFIAAGGGGLQVLDVSNPVDPRWVGNCLTDGWARGVAVAGGYAFIANGWAGVRVIDISNPLLPQWVGDCDSSGEATAVAASGDQILLADGRGGLALFQMNIPFWLSYPFPLTETAGTVQVLVQRTDAGQLPSVVKYRTVGGTAIPGVDYLPVAGTFEFPPGSSTLSFSLTALDDSLAEGAETIELELVDNSNGTTNLLTLKLVDNEAPVHVDGRFSWSGLNENIAFIDRYPDGRFLFSTYDDAYRYRLVRLTGEGKEDSSFRPPSFEPLAALPDGGALCRSNSAQIIRLTSDGRVDTGFQSPLLSANGWITETAVQHDGKILVCISTSSGNAETVRLLRLANDGTLDSGFTPAHFSAGTNSAWIRQPIIQADGRILVYGAFNAVNGHLRNGLSRVNIDGALDDSFVPALSAQPESSRPWVSSLSVLPDAKIYVCGWFAGVADTPRPNLLRLNSGGSLDPAFDAFWDPATSPPIAIAGLPDGGLIAAGSGMRFKGSLGAGLVRLSPAGSLLPTFSELANQGEIRQMWVDSTNTIVVHTTVNTDPPKSMLARIFMDDSGLVGARFSSTEVVLVEPVGAYDLAVERLGDSTGSFQVNLTAMGTATAGADFIFPATLTFAPLQTRQTCRVRVFDDGTLEGVEQALISLSSTTLNFIPGTPLRIELKDNEEPFVLDSSALGIPGQGAGWHTPVLPAPDGTTFFAGNGEIWRLLPDGRRDPGFVSPNFDGEIYALALTPQGMLVVGGYFTRAGSLEVPGLVRLDANGSLDDSFAPDTVPGTPILRVQPDGKVLVVVEGRLKRLLPDGKTDPGWTDDSIQDGTYVQAIELLADGRVLALTNNSIVRLLPDGAVDATFHSPYVRDPSGGQGWINTMAVDRQGCIVIGGYFSFVDDFPRSSVARLTPEGDVDPTFVGPGSFDNVYLHDIVCELTGEILVSGRFTKVDGVNHPYLVWLDSSGRPLHSAGPNRLTPDRHPMGFWPVNLAVQPDGRVWVWPVVELEGVIVPGFTRIFPPIVQTSVRLEIASTLLPEDSGPTLVQVHRMGDLSAPLTVRLRTQSDTATAGADFGAVDLLLTFAALETIKTIQIPIFDDLYSEVDEVLMVQLVDADSEELILGGERSLVILDNERRGSVDLRTANPIGQLASVQSLAEQSGNRLLVWSSYGRLLRLLPDGTVDPTFQPDTSGGWYIRVLPDDRLIVWREGMLARLLPDGALDTSFQLNQAEWTNRWVEAVEVQADGKLLVSDQRADSAYRFILRLLPNGSKDPGFSDIPLVGTGRLLALRDGRTLLYGDFTLVGGVARSGLAMLKKDGTLDITFAPLLDGPSNRRITAAAETLDGKILVAGILSVTNGVNVTSSIVQLLPDGRLDPAFAGSEGASDAFGNLMDVFAIAILSDGGIVVGGGFSRFGGQPHHKLAFLRQDGTLDPSSDTGIGLRSSYSDWDYSSSSPSCLETLSDGRIAVGGYFNRIFSTTGPGELAVSGLIMLNGPTAVKFLEPELLLGGTFRFSLRVEPGGTYVLESSDDLRQWTPILTNRAYERVLVFDDPGARGMAHRFFRALRQSGPSALGALPAEDQNLIAPAAADQTSLGYEPSTISQPQPPSKQFAPIATKRVAQGSTFDVPTIALPQAVPFGGRAGADQRIPSLARASDDRISDCDPRQATEIRRPREQREPDVEYLPTPQVVVDRMLKLAAVQPGDILYDLGCGDGRIVVTAAKQYGIRAVGVELNPGLVAVARKNAEDSGVAHLVRIVEADLFSVDFREATVVTLYLSPELNERLKPQLRRLRPGARVLSHDFGLKGVNPTRVDRLAVKEDRGGIVPHTVFEWSIPFGEQTLSRRRTLEFK